MNKLELRILSKEIAKQLNKSREGLEHLKLFSDIFKKRPGTINLLSNPMIPFDKREEVFKKAIEVSGVPETSSAILISLFKSYGLNLLPQIIKEIENEFLKIEGILPVEISIPLEFDEDLKKKIIKYLENKFNKKIKPNFVLKPEILGGFEATSESYHLVASLKGHLQNIKLKEEKWQ